MILFSSFYDINLLPRMLADCCMLPRQEWGLVAAVGQWRPQWLINVRNLIEQKISPPALIPPSVPTPPLRIIPPWCSESADAKKQPILIIMTMAMFPSPKISWSLLTPNKAVCLFSQQVLVMSTKFEALLEFLTTSHRRLPTIHLRYPIILVFA